VQFARQSCASSDLNSLPSLQLEPRWLPLLDRCTRRSLARIFFPLVAGLIAEYLGGAHVVFGILCIVLTGAISVLLSYKQTYLAYCT
jgi:hypothetical protein